MARPPGLRSLTQPVAGDAPHWSQSCQRHGAKFGYGEREPASLTYRFGSQVTQVRRESGLFAGGELSGFGLIATEAHRALRRELGFGCAFYRLTAREDSEVGFLRA